MALLLQLGFGLSAFEAGLMMLASAIGSLMMRFTFQPILRLTGFRNLLIGNAIITGVGLGICGFFRPGTPFLIIAVVLFIVGYSRSIQFTAVQSLVYADMPMRDTSRATSFSAMTQQLMQSIGVGVGALVIHLSLVWNDRSAVTPDDIAPAFFLLGGASLASVIIFWLLPAAAGSELSKRRMG